MRAEALPNKEKTQKQRDRMELEEDEWDPSLRERRRKAEFFVVYRRQLTYFVTQALIFVAALAWSSAMTALFAYAIPAGERQQMWAKFVYAFTLTLGSVLVIYLLAKNSSKNALEGISEGARGFN